jgi:hypothetical protein
MRARCAYCGRSTSGPICEGCGAATRDIDKDVLGMLALVGNETVLVEDADSTQTYLTVVRGFAGTNAMSHVVGESVRWLDLVSRS